MIIGAALRPPPRQRCGDRGREEQVVPGDRPRLLRPHRQAVQSPTRPLGLRHDGARQRHRLGGGEVGRQDLVLPHRRLRLRPCARARRHRGRQGERRQGARQRAGVRSTRRTSPPSCCRRRPRRHRSSASPMPAATPSTRSSRRPSSASSRAARSSRASWCSSPTCTARPASGAGPAAHRGLLLGPERRDPRLRQALRRQDERQDADHASRPATTARPRTT